MVLYDGTSMVERRMADKVTILSANNDAVTIDLDATTHLPLRRTFQWRNTTFKDYDEDVEEYDDYHTVQGLPTALHHHPLPQRRHDQPALHHQGAVQHRPARTSCSIPTTC